LCFADEDYAERHLGSEYRDMQEPVREWRIPFFFLKQKNPGVRDL